MFNNRGNINRIRRLLSVRLIMLLFALSLSGCGRTEGSSAGLESESASTDSSDDYTLETKVVDVMEDPVFGDYGRLIFPVNKTISNDLELQDAGEILTWYNNVNPERTVEIANYLKDQAEAGEQIFYDIYTDEEKAESPDKEDTGLFFFRGNPGARTAVVNAGGGFVYAMPVWAPAMESLPGAPWRTISAGYRQTEPMQR